MKICLKLLSVYVLQSNICDFLIAKRIFLLLISSFMKSTVAEILKYATTAVNQSQNLR